MSENEESLLLTKLNRLIQAMKILEARIDQAAMAMQSLQMRLVNVEEFLRSQKSPTFSAAAKCSGQPIKSE